MAIRTATAASVLGLIAALVFVTSNPRAALAEVQAAVDRLTSATYTISETVGELATQTTRVSVFGDKYVCAERSNGNYFVLDVIDKKMLEVVPSQKKAVLTEEVEVPVHFSLMARINSLNDYAIRGEPNTPQPEFGNKRVMGFVVRLDGVSYNIWVDQDTNLPLRLESYSDDDNVKRVWSDFVYNSKLDKASFSMSPPEGFSLEVLTFAKAREKANERAARAKIESLKQIREQALQRKPAED